MIKPLGSAHGDDVIYIFHESMPLPTATVFYNILGIIHILFSCDQTVRVLLSITRSDIYISVSLFSSFTSC